jgi:hypothetical protein
MSVEENLEPKLSWLQERLNLDDRSLSKFVTRSPSVFSCSIENLEQKLAKIQERLMLDNASLGLVVQRMPQLLCLNIETNLEPTMRFYEECVGVDAARIHLAQNPRLFSASLAAPAAFGRSVSDWYSDGHGNH